MDWRRGNYLHNENHDFEGLFGIRRGNRIYSSFDTIHRPESRSPSYPVGVALVVTIQS